MTTIWVIPIEKIEMRYTAQWYTDIPAILSEELSKQGLNWKVVTVPGQSVEDTTTPGAFLDFGATNFYKGTQTASISKLFSQGQVQPGDKFLVTDFWHFGITAIRYMSELLDIPVEIHGIAHAGAYDPTDILGMKMTKPWPHEQEKAWFHACDYLYFGTDFHKNMFLKNLKISKKYHKKAVRSGQPSIKFAQSCFDYGFKNDQRDNIIVFPHRLNSDKQPEIFRDLMTQPGTEDWKYVVTQDSNFTKQEYYNVLAQSKIVFSCSLHENLGIGQMEGALCGCVPVMPDRSAYTEMYDPIFKYPSEWTQDFQTYENHKQDLVNFINNVFDNYQDIHDNQLLKQAGVILSDYMSPQIMVDNLLKPMKV